MRDPKKIRTNRIKNTTPNKPERPASFKEITREEQSSVKETVHTTQDILKNKN